MHPVFQKIFNSRQLKGTVFVPTAKAWDNFFDLLKQRRGNPEAPAMVARYGQILLYHLAQDIDVPIADPVGTNKFAVETASTLQCTYGPGLPNNRLIVKKTPEAFLVSQIGHRAPQTSPAIHTCCSSLYKPLFGGLRQDMVLYCCPWPGCALGRVACAHGDRMSSIGGSLSVSLPHVRPSLCHEAS